MIAEIIRRLAKGQLRNGSWPVPTKPETRRTAAEMRSVYVHQAILGLAPFPALATDAVARAVAFLSSVSMDEPLFDITLKIRPFLAAGHIEDGAMLARQLAARVSVTGHIDYSKRREATALDPLLTLESLLAARAFSHDELVSQRIDAICGLVQRSTNETFRLGNDPANWVWAARLILEAGRHVNAATLRSLAQHLSDTCGGDGLWSYEPGWTSNHVPHFRSKVVYTSHILINLAGLARDLPHDLLSPTLHKGTYALLDIYRRMLDGKITASRSYPLADSAYGYAVALRAISAAYLADRDSSLAGDILRIIHIDEHMPPCLRPEPTDIGDLDTQVRILRGELSAYLSAIDKKIDLVVSRTVPNDTTSFLEWSLPVVPSLLYLKRRRAVPEAQYPTLARALSFAERVLLLLAHFAGAL
jgi:hypothetical protein